MIRDILGLSAALEGAIRSGLLASVIEHPQRTAEGHAKALGLDPRGTRLVLDVLVAFDVAKRSGEQIGPSDELVRTTVETPGGLARTLAMWRHVPAFLSTGDPFVAMDVGREAAYAGVVAALGKMMEGGARELAERIPRKPREILDIGCGSGVWSLALAERHPDARVTGLDLPAVLEAFRARAGDLGLAGRIDTLPGDIHGMTLPRKFDLVVIANVLRIESPERASAIVSRAATALAPGGALLVIDALAGGTPDREQARAVYALHLGMRTINGRVYSRAEILEWMNAAQLTWEWEYDLQTGPGAVGAVLAG